MIYIIIIIIIYFVLAAILKFLEYYLMLPIFNDFNNLVIMHPILLIPRLLYSIIYSTQAIVFNSIVLVIIILLLLILYLFRFILLIIIPFIYIIFPIPFGIVIYEIVPPFRQLEDAGIFKLMDDIGTAIIKYFPSINLFIIKFINLIVTFSKDKFLDLVKEVMPDVELDKSQFNNVFVERFMNNEIDKEASMKDVLKDSKIKIREFIEKFEENAKQNSNFYNYTKNAINQGLAAETYKSYDSKLPNMTLIEIMTTALKNISKTFNNKTSTVVDNLKLEISKTAD